jgi:hypothetical protein
VNEWAWDDIVEIPDEALDALYTFLLCPDLATEIDDMSENWKWD